MPVFVKSGICTSPESRHCDCTRKQADWCSQFWDREEMIRDGFLREEEQRWKEKGDRRMALARARDNIVQAEQKLVNHVVSFDTLSLESVAAHRDAVIEARACLAQIESEATE